MTTLLDNALALAALEIPVFPLRSNKQPCNEGGFKVASTDQATVRRLFANPLAMLIGVPTGPESGFDILDIDPRAGGDVWYRENKHRIPATRIHFTRSGGIHVFFRHTPGMGNSASRIAPGVDVRGKGGYIVWWQAHGFAAEGDVWAPWPKWLLLEALRPVNPNTPTPNAEDLAPPDAESLLRLLKDMPNPAEATREDYTAVCLAVQGAIRGLEALNRLEDPSPIYDAAAEWAERWESPNVSDFATERARWDDDWSLRDRDISGWRHLIGLAGKLGADVSGFVLAAAASEFGALPDEPEAVGNPKRPAPSTSAGGPTLDHNAPLASARELVARQFTQGGHQTVFHHGGVFYRWADSHYQEIPAAEIRAEIYRFLEGASVEEKGVPAPFNPTRHRVADVLEALAAATHLSSNTAAPAWLGTAAADKPPPGGIVACANGLLHVPTRRLIPHTPTFFNTHAIGYGFDAAAPKPSAWLGFLAAVWPDDPEAIRTLQEIIGLLLTADTRFQKIFMLIGPRRSGKGTIARVLAELLGPDNVCNPSLASLGSNFGAAPLIGKPLATITDARLNGRSDIGAIAERLLSISGQDGQTIDRKYREPWSGKLPTRFLMLTNELPRLTDASGALASRFVILQMQQSFYGREDLGLTERLLPELPGILNWALDGLERLTARGRFVQPASAREAIADLEDLASPVGAFLKAACVVGRECSVGMDILYDAWVLWCRDQGQSHVTNKQVFGRDLRSTIAGLTTTQRRMPEGERVREYVGVRLATPNRFGTADAGMAALLA